MSEAFLILETIGVKCHNMYMKSEICIVTLAGKPRHFIHFSHLEARVYSGRGLN